MGQGRGDLATAIEISRYLRRSANLDVVFIHSVWSFVTTLSAAQAHASKIPYVLCPHGMFTDVCLRRHWLRKRLFHFYARRTVAGAAAVRFLTDAERDMSLRTYIRIGRSIVIPNGVDVHTPIPDGKKGRIMWPQLGDGPLMAFIGRLHPIKNLGLQLDVLRLLLPRFPALKWLLIGPDDGELGSLMAAAQRYGVQDHVVWLGPIFSDDRFMALAAANVLLQTSVHEAHSMSVNEALSVGIPVVATESVNFPGVAQAGAGFVVPSNAEVVADRVATILADQELGREMGRKGREYACADLSWSGIAKDLEDRLVEILPRRAEAGVR
jgi:glycosyltransferase involved in cell wall biosynthesis